MLQRNNFISCFVTSHKGAEMLVLFQDFPVTRRKTVGAYIHMHWHKKRVAGNCGRFRGHHSRLSLPLRYITLLQYTEV